MSETTQLPPALNPTTPAPRGKSPGCLTAALVAGCIVLVGILVATIFLVVVVSKVGESISQATDSSTTIAKKPNEEHISGPSGAHEKIAVIDVKGIILNSRSGGFGGSIANAGEICDMLKAAGADARVKAVILDMDTPGGEVTASDEIHNAVQKLRERHIPVVTCMHSLGASGGYYIAAGTDYIIANRHTFTGSVGVIMSGFNYAELMGKIGLKSAVYKSGAMKDMLSGSRPTTPQEEAYMQQLIRETFLGFVDIVAKGRKEFNGDTEAVLKTEFADGRVVSGKDALRLKLVDRLGYFQDAVDKAGQLGGAANAKVIRFHRSMSLADILFSAQSGVKLNVVTPLPVPAFSLNPGQAYYIHPAYAQ